MFLSQKYYINNIETVKVLQNLETIQFKNSSKENNKPLRIIVLFFSDNVLFEEVKKYDEHKLKILASNIDVFGYENTYHLVFLPQIFELGYAMITRKLLLHYNRNKLVGLFILVVSFDGKYINTCAIPSNKYNDNYDSSNLLFVITDTNILIEKGLLSPHQNNIIIKKLNK